MAITYPPTPDETGQYQGFPQIPARGVPRNEMVSVVMETHRALQPSGQKESSEMLGAPVALEFGVFDLSVQKGGRRSYPYDDGVDTEEPVSKKHETLKDFCFAPGVDDKDQKAPMEIAFQGWGLANIKSAKLELYANGHPDKPIWEHHWGNAWAKQNSSIGDLPTEPALEGFTGTLAWSEVKPDKAIKVAGDKDASFPKGLLTAAHSPYQLKMTVSGCTAKGKPENGDKMAYPMTTWTYVHVLVHDFEFDLGKPEWLKKERTDIADEFKDKVVGTRESKKESVFGKDYGFEGEIMEEIEDSFDEDSEIHAVNLAGDLYVADVGKVNGDKSREVEVWEDMWGAGPRIPLAATPRIRTCAGTPTSENIADVCRGLKVLWDWSDEVSDEPRWKRAISKAEDLDHIGIDATKAYLEKAHEPCAKYKPANSFNCPIEFGGKLGDEMSHVFHDSQTTSPYPVTRLTERHWAGTTVTDDKGVTGVVFQPSRFAGDTYEVRAYPYFEGMDNEEAFDPKNMLHGYAGRFVVYRRIEMHHLQFGGFSYDLGAVLRGVKARLRRQCHMTTRIKRYTPTGPDYKTFLDKVLEKAYEEGNVGAGRYSSGWQSPGLTLGSTVVNDGNPGNQALRIRSVEASKREMKRRILAGKIRVISCEWLPKVDPKDDSTKAALQERILFNDGAVILDPLYTVKLGDDKEYLLVLAQEGVSFPAHNAEGKGEASGLIYFAKYTDALSVPEFEVTLQRADNLQVGYFTKPKVTISLFSDNGITTETLEYKNKAWSKAHHTDLTQEQKDKLRNLISDNMQTHDEGRKLKLQVSGRGDSTNRKQRLDNVVNFIKDLGRTTFAVVDRSHVADQCTSSRSKIGQYFDSWMNTFKKNNFASAAYEALVEEEKIENGVVVIHCQRASNLQELDAAKGRSHLKDSNGQKLDYRDSPFGSMTPGHASDKLNLSMTQLSSPDANLDSSEDAIGVKTPESVLIHEVGHSLFLQHSDALPGRILHADATNPGNTVGTEHVTGAGCLMDYDKATHIFCGVCMLRMRGWSWKELTSTGAKKDTRYYVRDFGLGDVKSMFRHPINTPLGQAERLQVLGLFNRPLRQWDDSTLSQTQTRAKGLYPIWQGADFMRCLEFSKAYAQEVCGSDVLATDHTFKRAYVELVLSGDNTDPLPPTGAARKVRVWGGYTVLHPSHEVEWNTAKNLGHKPDDREIGPMMKGPPAKEFLEELWAQEVPKGRDQVQAAYFDDNPALGRVPITVKVEDGEGNPACHVFVQVQIVDPGDAEAFDPNFGGRAVLGATSYNDTTGVPDSHKKPKDWYGKKVLKCDEPFKHLAHYTLGGHAPHKIGQPTGSRGEDTEDRFLFGSAVGWEQVAFNTTGAIRVLTNEAGEASFTIRPRVGGDRFKLEFSVVGPDGGGNHNVPLSGTVRTGAFVVWRMGRICRHVTIPNITSVDDLPAAMREWIGAQGKDPASLVKPLQTIDWKAISKEFAKTYFDVLFDRRALTPESLYGQGHWGRLISELQELKRRYPTVANVSTWCHQAQQRYYQIALAPVEDSKRLFRGKFPTTLVDNSIFLASGEVGDINEAAPFAKAFAQSYVEQWKNQNGQTALMALNPGDEVLAHKGKTSGGPAVAFDANIDASYVNVDTGEVQVTFSADQNGPFLAAAQLRDCFDVTSLISVPHPARSPWMVNMVDPKTYNGKVPTGLQMPTEKMEHKSFVGTLFSGGGGRKSDKNWAFGIAWPLQAILRSVDGNGQFFFPGVVVVQAHHLDPYTWHFHGGYGGRGVGNGVMLLDHAMKNSNQTQKLALHEIAHCFYLTHAFGMNNLTYRHSTSECVMNYEDKKLGDEDNHKGFCGKCQATLRGAEISTLKDYA